MIYLSIVDLPFPRIVLDPPVKRLPDWYSYGVYFRG